MSHYVVTGSAGLIGASVTRILLSDGHSVTGIDNLNDSYDIRLKEWRRDQLLLYPKFEFYLRDICQMSELQNIFNRRIDGVINLAARAGVRASIVDPFSYYETNVTGTINLLELCKENQIKKFVLASTSSLYGDSSNSKFSETQTTDYPISPYAASKKAAEAICYTYHNLYDIDISIPRYFTVYGPAGRPDMAIFRFIQWIAEDIPITIFGDGEQTRDFTYVDDVARGTVSSLRQLGYQVINIGSNNPVSVNHCISLIEQTFERSAQKTFLPSHPADAPRTWADITKAKDILDWEPVTNIEEGIKEAIRWYIQNQSWARTVVTI